MLHYLHVSFNNLVDYLDPLHFSIKRLRKKRTVGQAPPYKTVFCTTLLLFSDFDFSLRGYFAVKLLRLIRHRYGQLFLVAIKLKIIWYTPRVPACA